MLSLFPQILFLTPLVGTILRVVVAFSLLYIAYTLVQRRDEIGRMDFPVTGPLGSSLVTISAFIKIVIAGGLFIGYATQLFAIFAFVVSLKHFVFAKRYPRATPLCRLDYFYLMILCVCLFIMGAGAFALDLPL